MTGAIWDHDEGRQPAAKAIADARARGIEIKGIAAALRDFGGIWEENVDAVKAFLQISTQWRDNGLDYAGVEAGLRLADIDPSRDLWLQIRAIELGVRAAISEARR